MCLIKKGEKYNTTIFSFHDVLFIRNFMIDNSNCTKCNSPNDFLAFLNKLYAHYKFAEESFKQIEAGRLQILRFCNCKYLHDIVNGLIPVIN